MTASGYHSCLIYGGPIYTMEASRPRVEAIFIRNGRIVHAGDKQGAKRLADGRTEVVDLAGRVALPGFIESHTHPFHLGRSLEQVDCRNCADIEALIDILAAQAKLTPKGEWVIGHAYDDTLLRDQRHPTREDLDRASKDHPIFIVHVSVHSAAANSLALQRAGIDRGTPDPDDGQIEHDTHGDPTGVLWEWAQNLVRRHLPAPDKAALGRQLQAAAQTYLRAGVTSAADAAVGLGDASTDQAEVLADAAHTGGFPIRLNAALIYPLWRELRDGTGPGLSWGGDLERVKARAVKLFQDGSIQLRTAALTQPYYRREEPASDHLIWPQARFDAIVEEVHQAGWQVWTHANGDAALDSVLAGYARALDGEAGRERRFRVEHCQTAREDQLDRMAELGVAASFFSAHVCYWGDRHRDLFLGPERSARIDPVASAIARGIHAGLHNDTPVTPVSPLLSIATAVSRRTSSGELLGPEQAITVYQGLRAMTLESAWLAFEENDKGTLREGKLGDVVVLEADPYRVNPSEIKDINVSLTLVGGRTLFRAA